MKHHNKSQKIIRKILETKDDGNLLEYLSLTLSGSALNSLLLEVFSNRTLHIRAPELLNQYINNRFTSPFTLNPLEFAKLEVRILEIVQSRGYEIFESSPVAPLGSCSVVGPVDQKNIISAQRNTEVVSDVTNIMALEVAKRKKLNPSIDHIKLGAAHRHIRAQIFEAPGFTPHFKILGLVTGAKDSGNRRFEVESIVDHVNTYIKILEYEFNIMPGSLIFQFLIGSDQEWSIWEPAFVSISNQIAVPTCEKLNVPTDKNTYYDNIRFKILYLRESAKIEIIDGGTVDWTQQFLQNRKERLLISGLGSEFLYRLKTESKNPEK